MAPIIHMDGFDHYAQNEIRWKFDSTSVAYTSWNISTSVKRTGRGSLQLTTNNNHMITKNLPRKCETVIVGFAAYFSSTANDHGGWHFQDHIGIQTTLAVNNDGSFSLYRGDTHNDLLATSASGIVKREQWHYIEWKTLIHDSNGTFEVRVDNVPIFSGESLDNSAQAGTGATSFILSSCDNAYYIDDFYIIDGDSAPNNDFLGDMEVGTLYASASGEYSQWTPSGEVDNYDCLNEEPASTTEYIVCSGENLIDTYHFDDLQQYPVDNIAGIQTTAMTWKDGAGVEAMKNVIRIGSSDYSGEDIYLPGSYALKTEVWDVNPDDSAQWELADVNNGQFGVKRVEP